LPRPPASGEDPGVTLDVLTLGEPLVAFVAVESGSLADAAAFRRHVAGAETNLAVGLARLGVRAGIVARVGDDGLGTAILRRLRAEGVDVEGVSVDAGAPTGVLIRERRAFGPSEVLYRRAGSAGSRLAPDDLGASGGLRGARWLHVTGITSALSPTARAAVDGAIAAARKAGATVSFDVNLRRRLWSEAEAAPVLTALARRADVVLGDPDELALASGGQDPVASLLEAGVSMVITKAGASASERARARISRCRRSPSAWWTPSAPATRSAPGSSPRASTGSTSPPHCAGALRAERRSCRSTATSMGCRPARSSRASWTPAPRRSADQAGSSGSSVSDAEFMQ
jgi:2-dehydro-3-deoxygluconokinase